MGGGGKHRDRREQERKEGTWVRQEAKSRAVRRDSGKGSCKKGRGVGARVEMLVPLEMFR